ncbi:cytochrome P450 [Dichomitus squalens]|uniref:Cytochrome P450 n=1 Tax=Dichomitus squalens TaxID=114155 RepID=A0A4Q9PMN2_9APHY|nr:cytochrome P450 [Dichomitus squalens]
MFQGFPGTMPSLALSAVLVALLSGIFVYAITFGGVSAPSGYKLPPGPFAWPLMGNMLNIRTASHPWMQFAEWSRTYGPVIHLKVLRYSIVVLNSPKDAFALLDQRSINYSDRPRLTMLSFLDLSWVIPLMQYGERWRKHRRLLHRYCNSAAARQYEPLQQRKARELLVQLRLEPDRFVEHSNYAVGTILLDLTYGTYDKGTTARYLQYAKNSADTLAEIFLPGALLVQYAPLLRYFPSWFPGSSYKNRMETWREVFRLAVNEPFDHVKRAMRDGLESPSFLNQMLNEIEPLKGEEYTEAETVAKNCASVVYGAGSDTMIATLITFFLAMILHPKAQQKARAELMSVVGPDRLPEFYDRPMLPYVNAIVKECTRWIPVTPLGAFHATMNDDVYEGYFIPKGSIVFANQWAMLHNPVEYPDPEQFNPERFLNADGSLNPDVRDPNSIAFGFGRRICPGRDISDATIFICVASILHVFNIGPELDADGRPVWPKVDVTSSLVCHPLPFKCKIVLLSSTSEHLVDGIDISRS